MDKTAIRKQIWKERFLEYKDQQEISYPGSSAFWDTLTPEKSVEELFSSIWNFKMLRNYINDPATSYQAGKSSSIARDKLMHGKVYRESGKLELALEYYNESVILAGYPDDYIQVSPEGYHHCSTNQQKVDSDNCVDECSVLALAYCARAELLFNIDQFELCQRDIDLALELRCPKAYVDHLSQLKSMCLIAKPTMNKKKAKIWESFSYKRPSPPKVLCQNPSMPALSDAVHLKFSPVQGRHLVAKRNIHPGEVVGVEKSFVTVLETEYLTRNCAVCMKRCLAPLPCPNCIMGVFCSVDCQREGMTGNHWQECSISSYDCRLNISLKLVYKIMMKVGYINMKNLLPQLKCETKSKTPETLGLNNEGIYDGTHYRSMYHLVTNKERLTHIDIIRSCIDAVNITFALLKSKYYFITKDGTSFTPNQQDIEMTGSTVLHHRMSIKCNTHGIGEPKDIIEKDKGIGRGSFPTLNLVNHSCNSSCDVIPYGNTMVLRAVQFIPAGAEITHNYGFKYNVDLTIRQNALKEAYFFNCTCEACENKWAPGMFSEVFPEIELKCVLCSQVIDCNTYECMKCCLLYDKRMPLAWSLHLTTYNYKDMRVEMNKTMVKVANIRRNELTTGKFSEEDMKDIIKVTDLICKYVKEPHPIHEEVRFMLIKSMINN